MRILMFPHHLEIGGSQTNAIDLARLLRERHGHEIVFLATNGPAAARLDDLGFRHVDAPVPRLHPSPGMMRALDSAVRRERIELIHAWDWPQCLDAFYGPHLTRGVPLLGSDMSMSVPRMLPATMPLTMGTPALADMARTMRSGPVWLLEPPVDTEHDSPAVVDGAAFRREWDLNDDAVIVVVSRLVSFLDKADGIHRAIDVVADLATSHGARLVIVGDGPEAPSLRSHAEAVNRRLDRPLVVMTGARLDPRSAYAAADVVIGMGSSILRGLAFERPGIVLGELGFCNRFDPETEPTFTYHGLWGTGDGDPSTARLASIVTTMLDDRDERARLGSFGRTHVVNRYGLVNIAAHVDRLYQQTIEHHPSTSSKWRDAGAAGLRIAASRARQQTRRSLHRARQLVPTSRTASRDDRNRRRTRP